MSRHSNDPLESVCSAMCFNIVQLCVRGWLRSMSAVRERCPQPLVLCASQRRMPCHWRRGNMQAWLAGEAADWCACCTLILCIMGHGSSDEHEAITLTESEECSLTIFCGHVCIFVPEFIEEKHLLYEQGIFKSVDLPIVTEQSYSSLYLSMFNTLF